MKSGGWRTMMSSSSSIGGASPRSSSSSSSGSSGIMSSTSNNSNISSNNNISNHGSSSTSSCTVLSLSTSEEDVTGWIESVAVDRLEELLRSEGHKIDCMDEGGMTLLHRSVLANRLEIVRLLISLGANARLANRDGWSPLHLAAHAGNSDILGFLLKS